MLKEVNKITFYTHNKATYKAKFTSLHYWSNIAAKSCRLYPWILKNLMLQNGILFLALPNRYLHFEYTSEKSDYFEFA